MLIADLLATGDAERRRDDEPTVIADGGAPTRDHAGRGGVAPSASERLLLLSEVRRVGCPAIFLDWGDALPFQEGTLFDIRGTADGDALASPPEELPAEVLESGIGIDHGWRHLAGCDCTLCCESQGARLNEAGGRAELALAGR